jgi:hypothetical protein
MRSIRRCYFLSIILSTVVATAVGCGRAATPPGSFTVVLLPDTQYYSEQYPDTYMAQTRWIKSRVVQDNIRFVIHLGDIVDEGRNEKEWQVADQAQRILEGVVPYSVVPGNHDLLGPGGKRQPERLLYHKYFPPARFEKCRWYGGHMAQTNLNNYCFFEGGGQKFMVVSLEFQPSDKAIEWAGGVIDAHRDRQVIVATHYYMRPTGRGNDQRPSDPNDNSPEELWNKLIRKHENVFLVVSGHVMGVNHQTSANEAGGKVQEILCDYQGFPNGGDGWLATLRFVPAEGKIHVQAYSPTLNQFNLDPRHTYTLDWEAHPKALKKAG